MRELLDSLPDGLPYTIASGGRRLDILAVLEGNGLAKRFPSFVCGDDVEKSKPDPECFRKGLELLQARGASHLEPATCLTFEDSFRGVEAAKKAGMKCVAVTHSYPAEKLTEADQVLDSLLDWTWG